jgi:hypothetical protein
VVTALLIVVEADLQVGLSKEPAMSHVRTLATTATIALFMLAVAHAGTMFRLEIGPPVAAGTATKILKNAKGKAVLAVRALVCNDLANVQITGTAEGIRNGARQSVPLDLLEVDKTEAIYAVQYQWPDDGSWVLHLKGSCSNPKAEASTLVPMNKMAFLRERTQVLREPATKKQLEDAVKELARSQS